MAAQRIDAGGVALRFPAFVDGAVHLRRHVDGLVKILDPDRQPVDDGKGSTILVSPGRSVGRGTRAFEVERRESLHARLPRLDRGNETGKASGRERVCPYG